MTKFDQQSILYEDNHIIIVNKKTGEIVQGDKTGDEPLSHSVSQFIAKRDDKPGNAFIGVIHRLDRPVSGVVIFAKTSKGLERMNQLFRDGMIKKSYWALVCAKPMEKEGILKNYLKKNEAQNKSYIVPSTSKFINDKTVKEAILRFKYLKSTDKYHLLEVELLTGRHHQIRCQLANIGCVIKGDLKYGAPRSNKDGGISLHARSISFLHPIKNINISIIAPTPDEAPWNKLCEHC